jgi:hypothetical protein
LINNKKDKFMASLQATNVTDDTKLEYFRDAERAYQDVEAAQREVKSAMGTYRGILKRAKKAGVSTEAITFTLQARRLDHDDLKKREQEKARMMALAGVWPSIDQDLFKDFKPTKDIIAREKDAILASRAYDDGVFHGNEGKNRTLNPHLQGSEAFDAWDRGWIAGQAKIVRERLSPKETVKAPRKGKVTAAAKETAPPALPAPPAATTKAPATVN